jgi:hypothetical protein
MSIKYQFDNFVGHVWLDLYGRMKGWRLGTVKDILALEN